MHISYDLYVITDEKLSHNRSHTEIARAAILGGADVIQLRDKECRCSDLIASAYAIRDITKKENRLFIINDRLDVALITGADGVHLGQDDIPIRLARKFSPKGFIIGISVGSVEEAVLAEMEGADYVALSPVFSTTSKEDAGFGHGLDMLMAIRSSIKIPLLAIGGIGPGNVTEVILAGADGVAVISAVVSSPDMSEAARELKSSITVARQMKLKRNLERI